MKRRRSTPDKYSVVTATCADPGCGERVMCKGERYCYAHLRERNAQHALAAENWGDK